MDQAYEFKLNMLEMKQDIESYLYSKSKYLMDELVKFYPLNKKDLNFSILNRYLKNLDKIYKEILTKEIQEKVNIINLNLSKNEIKSLINDFKLEMESLKTLRNNKKGGASKLDDTTNSISRINENSQRLKEMISISENKVQVKELQESKIMKIGFGRDYYYLGEVKPSDNDNYILNGQGILINEGEMYFFGEFVGNYYKNGILYNEKKNQLYIGNFKYIIENNDKKNEKSLGHYFFTGIKIECYCLENYKIFIGEYHEVNSSLLELNKNIKGITILINKKKPNEIVLNYLGNQHQLNINLRNETFEIIHQDSQRSYFYRYNYFIFMILDNKKNSNIQNLKKSSSIKSTEELELPYTIYSRAFKIKSPNNLKKLKDLIPKGLPEKIIKNDEKPIFKGPKPLSSQEIIQPEKEIFELCEIYNGELDLQTMLPNGEGTFFFSNEENIPEHYEGNFFQGTSIGKCKYVYNCKDIISGDFVDNEITNVSFNDINGKEIFKGKFEGGLPKEGTILFNNGDTFTGFVNENFIRSDGVYSDSNGNSLKIAYDENLNKTGKGMMICKNNNGSIVKYNVVYERNKLIDIEEI